MYIEMIVQDNIFFIKKCFLFLNGSYIILINAVFGVFYRFNLFYLAFFTLQRVRRRAVRACHQ